MNQKHPIVRLLPKHVVTELEKLADYLYRIEKFEAEAETHSAKLEQHAQTVYESDKRQRDAAFDLELDGERIHGNLITSRQHFLEAAVNLARWWERVNPAPDERKQGNS